MVFSSTWFAVSGEAETKLRGPAEGEEAWDEANLIPGWEREEGEG